MSKWHRGQSIKELFPQIILLLPMEMSISVVEGRTGRNQKTTRTETVGWDKGNHHSGLKMTDLKYKLARNGPKMEKWDLFIDFHGPGKF